MFLDPLEALLEAARKLSTIAINPSCSGAEIAIDGGYFAAGLASLRNRLREDFAAGRS